MNVEYVKNGKGHDVFINGVYKLWVIGSKKNAEKEMKLSIKEGQIEI